MILSVNETHDPGLKSWVDSANDGVTDFPIQNLPYGVFRRRGPADQTPAIGVAIGDQILDLPHAEKAGLLNELDPKLRAATHESVLNDLAAQDVEALSKLRRRLVDILHADNRHPDPLLLVPMQDAELLLPIRCGDYTDFYASLYHATNVGKIFRPDNPLLPNYKYVPIAYHGRASSIIVSGTPVTRPWGQIKKGEQAHGRTGEQANRGTGVHGEPVYAPTEKLDYEAEVGFIVGRGNALGHPIPMDDAERHIFGVCLVNDWSARDIQAWEYQPLGPFLGKSFATTMSPWVVTMEALAPFRCAAFARAAGDPAPLEYLQSAENNTRGGLDLGLEVSVRASDVARRLQPSVGSTRDLYWTMAQMVAHHTSNGCNLRPGDLLASGTVSGPAPGSEGCLLERGGPFLADGDEVVMRGHCEARGHARIGLGACAGVIGGSR